jgi:hypothetical protein
MPRRRDSHRPRLTRISVRGELRSEPDWDRFAWALLQYAKLLNAREEQAKRRAPEPKA